MIFDTIANADRYATLNPLFPLAFDYIRNTDLNALAPGRYAIAGDALIVIIEHVQGRTREAAKLECHRKRIDIQLVLDGIDSMGWRPLAECQTPLDEYSEERDIRFFADEPAAWIATPPGAFCIFFPEDAHAPLVSDGPIRKAIFKVAAQAVFD